MFPTALSSEHIRASESQGRVYIFALLFYGAYDKVNKVFGMWYAGELPGAALEKMTKPDCEGARVPG